MRDRRELHPLSKRDEVLAEYFVAMASFSLFTTAEWEESRKRINKDNNSKSHETRPVNELESYQPQTPLQQSIKEGFVGFKNK